VGYVTQACSLVSMSVKVDAVVIKKCDINFACDAKIISCLTSVDGIEISMLGMFINKTM